MQPSPCEEHRLAHSAHDESQACLLESCQETAKLKYQVLYDKGNFRTLHLLHNIYCTTTVMVTLRSLSHTYMHTHTLHSQLFTLRSKRKKKELKIYDIKTHTYISNLEGRPAPIEPHPRRAPLMARRAYGLIKHRGHCFCW